MQVQMIGSPLVLLGPLVFIGIWLSICYFGARISGWRTLAETYRNSSGRNGKSLLPYWFNHNANMSGSLSRNSLKIRADETGLYLEMVIFFRPFHAPLFVPWTDVTVDISEHSILGIRITTVKIVFIKFPDFHVQLNDAQAAERLKPYLHGATLNPPNQALKSTGPASGPAA